MFIFRFLKFSQIGFLGIGLDWRALVESRFPNIEKQRGFFLAEEKYFSKIEDFLRKKKKHFLVIFEIF